MTTADPSNVVAQQMTGAASVQQDAGYTGRAPWIAVVDTGTVQTISLSPALPGNTR